MRLHPTAGSRGGGPRAAPHGRLRGDGPRTAPHGRLPASFCALRGHSVEGLPVQTRTKNKIRIQEQEEEAARESCRRCSGRAEEPMQELTERSMGLAGSIDVRSGFLQPQAPAAVRPSRSTTADPRRAPRNSGARSSGCRRRPAVARSSAPQRRPARPAAATCSGGRRRPAVVPAAACAPRTPKDKVER